MYVLVCVYVCEYICMINIYNHRHFDTERQIILFRISESNFIRN